MFAGSPRDMIFQLATQRSVAVGEKWHQNVYSSNSTSSYTSQLRYSYRVICDENYFGDNCSEFCKPRDDKFGHYICGTDGARVCLDGWKGDYCDEGKRKLNIDRFSTTNTAVIVTNTNINTKHSSNKSFDVPATITTKLSFDTCSLHANTLLYMSFLMIETSQITIREVSKAKPIKACC